MRSAPRIEQAQRGSRRLLPPTLITLASLLPFGTVAEAVAAAEERDARPGSAGDPGRAGTWSSVELPDGTVLPFPSR